jgi:hypothetical protein
MSWEWTLHFMLSAPVVSQPTSSSLTWLLWNLALVGALTLVLLLTYDHCIGCVLCVAAFSLLTINCIKCMPLVFLLSVCILVYHSIHFNLNEASIDVRVPLSRFVYVPNYKDFQEYVHLLPGSTPSPPGDVLIISPG